MAKKDWNDWWSKKNKDNRLFLFGTRLIYNNYLKLLNGFKIPKNPKILELGCGSGIITLWLLKKFGGKATIIDYSKESIRFAEKLFKQNKMKVKIINRDITKVKLKKEYDLVHSQGLIEHFKGKTQDTIIKKHGEFLKKNGITLLTAPRPSFWYNTWRRTVEFFGKWPFGYEKPIKSEEGIRLLERNGLKVVKYKKFKIETGYVCKKR